MSVESDARFWDRTSRKYAAAAISDQAGYEHTLSRTLALLRPSDRVLEFGCGTGTTALRLAGQVQSYLATDISAGMITIARERHATNPVPGLEFSVATAESFAAPAEPFDAILAFNYLHLVRDLPGTLRRIHALLADQGVFISKTPCVGEMNPFIRRVMLPVMRAVGKAPYAGVFRTEELTRSLVSSGFDLVSTEYHATRGNEARPYIAARKQ